jgi:hypothetical protein
LTAPLTALPQQIPKPFRGISIMSDKFQYKAYSTRKMRADLHTRMRVVAGQLGLSIEEAFNLIVEAGLEKLEPAAQKAFEEGGR